MVDRAFVFDAYGTLFDVHSAVSRHAALVGPNAARLSEVWRSKQLEYTWTRSGMGKYKDFLALTVEALDFALEFVPDVNSNARAQLLEAYQTLDCYEEVRAVLETLKQRGHATAILSNGTPDMLNTAIASAGLSDVLDDVFSAHDVGVFKTNFATYSMVTKAYDIAPSQVSFQSSNRWDVAGASAFGFNVCWINRTNQPDEYQDLPPTRVISDLRGLLE